MFLEPRTHYLVLHDVPGESQRKLLIVDTLDEAVAGWTPGSRLSPVWAVKDRATAADAFAGRQRLLFVGPVQPARLTAEIKGLVADRDLGMWLSAGCFNVVMRIANHRLGAALARRVRSWARAQGIAHEEWQLQDGVVTSASSHVLAGGDPRPILNKLASQIAKNENPLLRPGFQEHLVVTATSLARAATIYPPIFTSVAAVADAGCGTIATYLKGTLGVPEMQSRLLSMNAALSRFSSQAFSGTPPIQATECHFWIHSLLGTGSANLALAKLVGSIQVVLGEARLPERLEALETKTAGVLTKDDLVSDILPKFDLIRSTEADELGSSPIVPLITYFSGRDGFSSQLQTLSAPLTTVAECNSLRSNLLTVTHEISHIFVQSALSILSPSLGEDAEMALAFKIAAPGFRPQNQLEAARQLIVEAVITMESAHREVALDHLERQLPVMFERWRTEMQEILVHTFDFLYFHQGEPEYYVNNIWHSWCAIPGISDRVPEYLMRTLCAISAKLLDRKNDEIFRAAVENVGNLLADIKPNIGDASTYVDQALSMLGRANSDVDMAEKLEREFYARLYLVRLVRVFLYSEQLAAKLFRDPHTRASSAEPNKKKLAYNTLPIGNGLTFLKEHLKEDPTEAESLWVLHCLAYDLTYAEPVR